MALTKSEKLLKQVGQKVECDFCHKLIPFGDNWLWLMTAKREVVCPNCQDRVRKTGILLVSI